MPTLILHQQHIRELLPMHKCMELMVEAFKSLSGGDATNPLRRAMILPGGRLLGTMPGYLSTPEAFGLKVITVFPDNHRTPYDSHQGVVVLFETECGRPIAILDASEITAIRTAAASGAATQVLARDDAEELALLGAGVEARTHLEAMLEARRLRRVAVFSPAPAKREAFAARESKRHGITIEPVASVEAAVDGADLICTTTSARTPILEGRWIVAGAHVNAVGACTPRDRELDASAIARASLFCDCRESFFNEAGDFLLAREEGAVDDDHLRGEVGEVLLGRIRGRRSGEEVTIFESLGIAVQDLAAARYVVAEARARGVGSEVELGGLRDAPA